MFTCYPDSFIVGKRHSFSKVFFYSFAYRLKLDADVHAVELPLKYFVGMTNQLESLLDQVNNICQCSTSGCNGK